MMFLSIPDIRNLCMVQAYFWFELVLDTDFSIQEVENNARLD